MLILFSRTQERRRSMFEADYNKRIREVEQKRKEQLLEDEERKVLQLRDAKQKQQEQLDLQKSAFEVEMQLERQAFLFQKEKDAYVDRRKQKLDSTSKQAADDRGSELFRRELFLSQTNYDRNIHSAARAPAINKEKVRRDSYDRSYSNDGKKDGDGSGRDDSGRDGSGNDDDDDDYERPQGKEKAAGVDFNPFAN